MHGHLNVTLNKIWFFIFVRADPKIYSSVSQTPLLVDPFLRRKRTTDHYNLVNVNIVSR